MNCNFGLQCRRIFGERTIGTSRNFGFSKGEKEISTKGVVDRQEEAALPAHLTKGNMAAQQTIASL